MPTETEKKEEEVKTETEEQPVTDYQLALGQANLQRSMGWIDEQIYAERVKEAEAKMTPEEKAAKDAEDKAKAEAEAAKKLESEETTEESAEDKAAREAKEAEEKAATEAKSKEEADAKAEAEKAAKQKAADDRKRERKAKREEKTVPELDDDPVQRAADLAAKKVLEARPTPDSAPDAFEARLPRAYQKDLAVARFIAQSDPKQANLPAQFLEGYKAETAYIAQWEKDHPGEEFDGEADEHKAFYARSFPKIDEDEFEVAREAMLEAKITERVEKKVAEKVEPKVKRVEVVEKLRETVPAIAAKAHDAVLNLLMAEEDGKPLFPTVHEQIVAGGKKLNDEVGKKIEEVDPVAFDILDQEVSRLRLLTTELRRLATVGEPYRQLTAEKAQNGESDDIREHAQISLDAHRMLDDYAFTLEKRFKGKEDEDGRKFITQEDLESRVKSIFENKSLKPEQRKAAVRDLDERFFTLNADLIERELIKDSAKKSSQEIAKIKGYAEKLYKSNGAKHTEKASSETTESTEETQAETRKPKPPTTVSSSDKTNTEGKGKVQGVITPEQFAKSAWS